VIIDRFKKERAEEERKNGANQFDAIWPKVPMQFDLNYLQPINLGLAEFEIATLARSCGERKTER
jgi:hypothetical protein